MDRSTCLAQANQLVVKERAEVYGDADKNFAKIASLWSTFLNVTISPEEAALMMVLLKICRAQSSGTEGSFIDMCGYASLACEITTNKVFTNTVNNVS